MSKGPDPEKNSMARESESLPAENPSNANPVDSAASGAAVAAPVPRRRFRFPGIRFSLRTAIILLLVLTTWLGLWVGRAEKQRRTVKSIRELRGSVSYRFIWPGSQVLDSDSIGGKWFVRQLGRDLFTNVIAVYLVTPYVTDESMDLAMQFPRLEELSIGGGELTEQGIKKLSALTGLNTLNLVGQDVPDVALAPIAQLVNLEWLSLHQTRVSDQGMKHLAGLSKIRHLDLWDTEITDQGLVHLSNIKDLRWLSLKGTRITDEGLKRVANFENLENLDLSDTRITDAGMEHLGRLKRLYMVQLQNTDVSEAGYLHLKELLPDCAILHASSAEEQP